MRSQQGHNSSNSRLDVPPYLGAFNMPQEVVAQAAVLVRALDQARDVRHGDAPAVLHSTVSSAEIEKGLNEQLSRSTIQCQQQQQISPSTPPLLQRGAAW